MKKVRITESEINRLVKKIVNESIIPPVLIRMFKTMDDVVTSKVVSDLDLMLKNKQVNDIIYIDGNKGTIKNGQQLLSSFIGGKLNSKDQKKVFDKILKYTEDRAQIDEMTNFLVDQMDFFIKYRGKTREQLISEFSPLYGEKKAKILADKIFLRAMTKTPWPTFWKMWREAWKSPKLWQMAFRIIRNPKDKIAWGNMMRWFITGTSRNIGKTFSDYVKLYEGFGFSKSVIFALVRLTASIGLEAFQRWLIVNCVVTIMNICVEWFLFMGTPAADKKLAMSDWEVIWATLKSNWETIDFWWLIPAAEVLPAIIRLVMGGPVRNMTPKQLYDYVINEQYPWSNELISLDNQYSDELLFIYA